MKRGLLQAKPHGAFLLVLLLIMAVGTSPVMAKTVIKIGTFLDPVPWEQRHGEQMRGFLKANPDLELEIIQLNHREFAAKIITLAATGDIPDVLQIPPEQVAPVVSAGVLENLDPWVAKDRTIDTKAWLDAAWDAMMFNGVRFGVPGYVVNYTYAYNKDILAERGLPYPKSNEWVTWDRIREIAKKATVVGGDGVVKTWGYFHDKNYTEMLPLIWQAGGEIFDSRQRMTLDTEPAYEAFEWLLGLWNDQLHGGGRPAFYSGQVASMRMGSWEMEGLFQAGTPVGVTSGMQYKSKAEVAYVTSYTMAAKSKNKDAAWRLLKYLTSRDGQEYIAAIGRVPMRRDVRIPNQRTEVLMGFINSLGSARSYPYHVYSDYIQSAFNAATAPIWNGTTTPKSILPELQRTINAFLDQK